MGCFCDRDPYFNKFVYCQTKILLLQRNSFIFLWSPKTTFSRTFSRTKHETFSKTHVAKGYTIIFFGWNSEKRKTVHIGFERQYRLFVEHLSFVMLCRSVRYQKCILQTAEGSEFIHTRPHEHTIYFVQHTYFVNINTYTRTPINSQCVSHVTRANPVREMN